MTQEIRDYIEHFLRLAGDPPRLRQLLEQWMATPEGRIRYLWTAYTASLTRYNFLVTKLHGSRREEYEHPWKTSFFRLEVEPLLNAIPLRERESEAYEKLHSLFERARALYGLGAHDVQAREGTLARFDWEPVRSGE